MRSGWVRMASMVAVPLVLALVVTSCVYPTPPPGDPVPGLTLTPSSPGTVEITVSATPTNFVPAQVQFRIDGLGTTPIIDTTAPFSVTLHSADLGPGPHSVHALGIGGGYFVGQLTTVELTRPNLVFVLVDDLDEVKSPYWDALPKTKALIADQGLTLENAFVVDPVCCPSRATFLTGRYAHNTGVFDNSAPDGGYTAFRDSGAENDTVATRLQAEGYETAFMGKYLNGYEFEPTLVPPGWDEWFGLRGLIFSGYNYGANHNGTPEFYGSATDDYQTDVLADTAVTFLDGTEAADDQPFFLTVSTVAPHANIPPAPRHLPNPFADAEIPITPNFDEADVSDKPTWLRDGFPPVTPAGLQADTDFLRRGLGSLLAVDDLVDDIATTLEANGELENTDLVFVSDNGYNLLSHRLPGKQAPYEESIRVPFVMSGPGIRAATEDAFVTNLDLAPTLLHLAGAGEPDDLDGRSLVPLLRVDDEPPWRSDFLVEFNGTYSGVGVNLHTYADVVNEIASSGQLTLIPTYRAVRSDTWLYVEWYAGSVHEYELYNMAADPYQLVNLVATPQGAAQYAATTAALQTRLNALRTCSGATCRT